MSTIKVGTLLAADGSTTTQPSIPALDTRMASAWVNFNGTGTVAIRRAFNVSSITDNGVGNFTINFTTAMVDANYSAIAAQDVSTSYSNSVMLDSYTTTTIKMYVYSGNASADPANASLAIFS
tara:strand:+ start:250 stop:618 length:369 start_codon:yes stop_codon:yes gene_type:complete